MLKLTAYHVPQHPIYISPKAITSIFKGDDFTTVICGSTQIVVAETPEEILAMPEMLNELHPWLMLNDRSKGAGGGLTLTDAELESIVVSTRKT